VPWKLKVAEPRGFFENDGKIFLFSMPNRPPKEEKSILALQFEYTTTLKMNHYLNRATINRNNFHLWSTVLLVKKCSLSRISGRIHWERMLGRIACNIA